MIAPKIFVVILERGEFKPEAYYWAFDKKEAENWVDNQNAINDNIYSYYVVEELEPLPDD